MEKCDSEVPLGDGVPLIGIIYNIKQGKQSEAPDAEAELDNIETVYAIQNALEKHGLRTVLLLADKELPEKLRAQPVDIAFNIAEGISGRGREALVPSLLDLLDIPYTGSDATTLCLALDKAITKRLLSTYRVRTPHYAVIKRDSSLRLSNMHYPIIIKPNAEGSSKGIGDCSVVSNVQELRTLVSKNFSLYGGDMLAEEYISGREFTVGVLGNGVETKVFSPMEIVYNKNTQGNYCVYSYNVKQNYQEYVSYVCPANIDETIEKEMMDAAKRIYEIMGCHDFSRVDFRLNPEGKSYFIEINPLPGLAPNYSDYPMLAEACGVPYDELVFGVLEAAAKRCGVRLSAEVCHGRT